MSKQGLLFPLNDMPYNKKAHQNSYGEPRLSSPIRNQVEIVMKTLDDLLPQEHLVREVWKYVEGLDLSLVLGKIQSVVGSAGRPASDPKIFLAVWLFATIKSIGSARLIEEYCREHIAFQWLCGGVSINYHSISDFRSDHGDQLDNLLTQSVAILARLGAISLEKVSQDGMRVRASAGSSTFKREETLENYLVLAQFLVQDLKEEAEKNPGACKSRAAAAQARAATERVQRIERALIELKEIRQEKTESRKRENRNVKEEDLEKVRASTTDPEARVMKMACGGFRPAYNVQFASTNKGKAIVGVNITKNGTDQKQTLNMIDQVESRFGIIPEKWLQDAGYENQAELNKSGEKYKNCKIYMPVKLTEKNKNNPHERLPKDSEIAAEWRERMGTECAKEIYKERASTAEFVNAQSRNKGLQQFLVRGTEKVTCVAFLYAIVQNMTIALNI